MTSSNSLLAKSLKRVIVISGFLALMVIMLGAYTRLTNAGLGCPDWPGCYGQLVLPKAEHALTVVQQHYPSNPLETRKAWTEMIHRYAAGTLALLIVFIALASFRCREKLKLPLTLVLLVLFQAALGMWTVTLKLLPVVVMSHLLGGILIFSCLSCLWLQTNAIPFTPLPTWRLWIGIGMGLVFLQIALGGWVSSNYAGIACIGFPQCNGVWFPTLHFSKGFNLFAPVGTNYQGGVLDNEVRLTIQFIHRLNAVITATYLLILTSLLNRKLKKLPQPQSAVFNRLNIAVMLLIILQFTLGMANVIYLLPLWTCVAHNGVAALIMAAITMIFYLTKTRSA